MENSQVRQKVKIIGITLKETLWIRCKDTTSDWLFTGCFVIASQRYGNMQIIWIHKYDRYNNYSCSFLALPTVCWHFPEAEFGNVPTLRSFRFKDRHTTRQSVDDAESRWGHLDKAYIQQYSIIISTCSVLSLQCNSEEKWVSILLGEFFLFFVIDQKLRGRKVLWFAHLQSFSIADLEGNQRAKSWTSHWKQENQQGEENPDQLNYIKPELWCWICKIWGRAPRHFH